MPLNGLLDMKLEIRKSVLHEAVSRNRVYATQLTVCSSSQQRHGGVDVEQPVQPKGTRPVGTDVNRNGLEVALSGTLRDPAFE